MASKIVIKKEDGTWLIKEKQHAEKNTIEKLRVGFN